MVCACNPCTWEVEAAQSGSQGLLQIHKESEATWVILKCESVCTCGYILKFVYVHTHTHTPTCIYNKISNLLSVPPNIRCCSRLLELDCNKNSKYATTLEIIFEFHEGWQREKKNLLSFSSHTTILLPVPTPHLFCFLPPLLLCCLLCSTEGLV